MSDFPVLLLIYKWRPNTQWKFIDFGGFFPFVQTYITTEASTEWLDNAAAEVNTKWNAQGFATFLSKYGDASITPTTQLAIVTKMMQTMLPQQSNISNAIAKQLSATGLNIDSLTGSGAPSLAAATDVVPSPVAGWSWQWALIAVGILGFLLLMMSAIILMAAPKRRRLDRDASSAETYMAKDSQRINVY